MIDEFEFIYELNDFGCFTHGITGNPGRIDWYMSVPEYDKIGSFLKELSGKYSVEEWTKLVKDLREDAYNSPNRNILAGIIERYYKLPIDKINTN